MKRIYIGIAGLNGAGKSELGLWLEKNLGLKKLSVSEHIRNVAKEDGAIISNRNDLREFANEKRRLLGPGYFVKSLIELHTDEESGFYIESIRCRGEVSFLKRESIPLIGIDADPKIRFKRIQLRGTDKDNVTFEEFLEQEEAEKNIEPYKQNLQDVLVCAERVFINNRNILSLYSDFQSHFAPMILQT